MEKSAVIEFFNSRAASWDEEIIKNDVIIGKILDNAEVFEGMDVLDVACGTGVLFPYYLERGVSSVTGVDISSEMIKIATQKFQDLKQIKLICGDVEELDFGRKFDRIVVYNAFPHFPNPRRLIKILSSMLKDNGRLTIAHGASRETIDGHHKGAACKVSNGLISADKLNKLFEPYFSVEIVISNTTMYQVSGVRRNPLADIEADFVPHNHNGVKHTHLRGNVIHEHKITRSETTLTDVLEQITKIIKNNDVKAQELTELACCVQQAGEFLGYDELLNTAADFDVINAKLDAILRRLTEK